MVLGANLRTSSMVHVVEWYGRINEPYNEPVFIEITFVHSIAAKILRILAHTIGLEICHEPLDVGTVEFWRVGGGWDHCSGSRRWHGWGCGRRPRWFVAVISG